MAIAFGAVLLICALAGAVQAYRVYDTHEKGGAFLYALASIVAGFFGYRQSTLSDHPADRPVAGVIIFVVALFCLFQAGREYANRFEDRPLARHQKVEIAGWTFLSSIFIAMGVLQFLYVV